MSKKSGMRKGAVVLRNFSIFFGVVCGVLFSVSAVSAWTAPPASPPNSNVAAPVNVGANPQTKNGTLGMNGLAVFGNSILQASSYLNWGVTSGSTGYGIRDNAGTLEFRNSGAPTWQSLQAFVAGLGTATQWTTNGTSIYYNGGNVGVGVAAPSVKFQIGNNVATGFLNTYPEYQQILYDTGVAASSYGFGIKDSTMVFNTGSAYSFDRGGSATSMSIDGAGNVGVGGAAAASRLFVQGGAYTQTGQSNQASYALGASSIAADSSIYSYGKICAGNANGDCSGAGGVVISSASIKFPDGTTQTTAPVSGTNYWTLSAGTLSNNSGTTISMGNDVDVTGGSGTSYSTAPIEVRTTLTPRISFHWPGVVASQIGMDISGNIRTYDNPGTGYAAFMSSNITAPILTDMNDSSYYMDPNGISRLNDIRPNIMYDGQDTAYYSDPNGTSNLNLTYVNDLRPAVIYDKNDTSYYVDANGTSRLNVLNTVGNHNINNTSPTIYLQDSDELSAMIHNNSNTFYILRGCAANSATWCTFGGLWPLTISLTNNHATFGGGITGHGEVDGGHGVYGYGPSTGSVYYGVVGQAGVYTGSLGRADGYSFVGHGVSYNDSTVYGTSFLYLSDKRLKDNVQPLDAGLTKIMALRPVSFTWNQKVDSDQKGKDDIGFIAQEVEKIMPLLVHTDIKGIKSIDYVKVVPMLVQGMQEQERKIDEQQKEIDALKSAVAELSHRVK